MMRILMMLIWEWKTLIVKICLKIRERFETSNFPYKVDIVDFSKASKSFKKQIYKSKKLWLIPKKK
jgi:hypothetical protein